MPIVVKLFLCLTDQLTTASRNKIKRQESELVEVQSDLKGHVIGKGGCNIREIMAKSGAKITSRRDEDSFLIRGDTEQRALAKNLILEKVVSFY